MNLHANPERILSERPATTALNVAPLLRRASKDSGQNRFGILFRWLFGAFLPRRMLLNEYITFRQHLPATDKKSRATHAGILEMQRMNRDFNGRASAVSHLLADKRRYAMMLAGDGFPTARIQAFVDPSITSRNEVPLRDKHDISNWLLKQAEYPIFGKPLDNYGSEGAVSINSLDKNSGILSLIDGSTINAVDLAKEVAQSYGEGGYLWMDRVRPHRVLRKAAGETVGCIRLVTITRQGKTTPLYAVWKIPAPGAVADNFWRPGNMLAELDLETGRVLRVAARGIAGGQDIHAQSETQSLGLMMPCWRQTLKTGIEAAQLTPEVGLIGFDIAITDDGPLILEANTNPDHRLWQLASGRGFLTESVRAAHTDMLQFYREERARNTRKRLASIRNFKQSDLPRLFDTMFRNKP